MGILARIRMMRLMLAATNKGADGVTEETQIMIAPRPRNSLRMALVSLRALHWAQSSRRSCIRSCFPVPVSLLAFLSHQTSVVSQEIADDQAPYGRLEGEEKALDLAARRLP